MQGYVKTYDDRRKEKKFSVLILAAVLVVFLLVAAAAIDYLRLRTFAKPVFAQAVSTADDGGSGFYRGIGYALYIEGNFMPEDEFPGVTRYQYYLCGQLIDRGIRD